MRGVDSADGLRAVYLSTSALPGLATDPGSYPRPCHRPVAATAQAPAEGPAPCARPCAAAPAASSRVGAAVAAGTVQGEIADSGADVPDGHTGPSAATSPVLLDRARSAAAAVMGGAQGRLAVAHLRPHSARPAPQGRGLRRRGPDARGRGGGPANRPSTTPRRPSWGGTPPPKPPLRAEGCRCPPLLAACALVPPPVRPMSRGSARLARGRPRQSVPPRISVISPTPALLAALRFATPRTHTRRWAVQAPLGTSSAASPAVWARSSVSTPGLQPSQGPISAGTSPVGSAAPLALALLTALCLPASIPPAEPRGLRIR